MESEQFKAAYKWPLNLMLAGRTPTPGQMLIKQLVLSQLGKGILGENQKVWR